MLRIDLKYLDFCITLLYISFSSIELVDSQFYCTRIQSFIKARYTTRDILQIQHLRRWEFIDINIDRSWSVTDHLLALNLHTSLQLYILSICSRGHCGLISILWQVWVDFYLMKSVGWFPSYDKFGSISKCGLISILWQVWVDCHLKRSSGWFLSYDKWRLIFILWEVRVDFYSMASVGCFPCYGKCWLIFILWEVRVDEVLYKGGRQVWVGGETSGKVSPHQSVG